jgi:quercetin dioxygenase-like cupin family protein
MEIARFGVGHRRAEGPAGSRNLQGQVIHSAPNGVIAELAFGRGGAIQPHSNPRTTWFVVIEGGGFVLVGDEQARVAAGEAVLWPAGIVHAAWTDQTPMRAIVVEFPESSDSPVLEGNARELGPGERSPASARAEGGLVQPPPSRYDVNEGEPF